MRRVAALDPDVRERIMMTAGVRDIESRDPRSRIPLALVGASRTPDLAHFVRTPHSTVGRLTRRTSRRRDMRRTPV